jgi:flagellar protein FlbD
VLILLSRGLFEIFAYCRRSRQGFAEMIVLTRLNGQNFVVNAEKIRLVESTPDTVVCCETGERFMVKETLHEVVQRAIEYGRLLRRPLTE